jgi:hypothetical protein
MLVGVFDIIDVIQRSDDSLIAEHANIVKQCGAKYGLLLRPRQFRANEVREQLAPCVAYATEVPG